jgi:hypothetical protein
MSPDFRLFTQRLSRLEKDLIPDTDIFSEHMFLTGYHSFEPDFLKEGLEFLRREQALPVRPKFFDFGAGPGKMMATAAFLGFDAYGTEIDQELASAGLKVLKTLHSEEYFPQGTVWQLAQGNYFPEEYQRARNDKKAIAIPFEENDYLIRTNPGAAAVRTGEDNPYQSLGIQLDDIDVFFAYTWSTQLPAILEIFSRHGRDDAVLLNYNGGSGKDCAPLREMLGLRQTEPNLRGGAEGMLSLISKARTTEFGRRTGYTNPPRQVSRTQEYAA